jgi:uncharacterized membrane protein
MNKVGWGFFLILSFIITLPVSWWLLAKVDFAYPVLYESIGIPAHIDQYAPRNYKGKLHFEQTSKGERISLFHEIITEIQSDGSGLDKLSYIDRTNKRSITLFTKAEVIHLQDVANLLTKLKIFVLSLAVFWLVVLFILWQRKKSLPSSKQLILSSLLIVLVAGLLLLLGPEAIFNQLHIWIFPDNHQWYFYYEESLMSTMMKAPDLFAYIAGMWAFVSIVLTGLLLLLVRKLLN